MSKLIIEQALRQAIAGNNLHQVALTGGNEDLFTRPMVNYIPHCYEQVRTYRSPVFGGWRNIDLVTFQPHPPVIHKPVIDSVQHFNIDWALEAKHYTPHQRINDLDAYKHWSVGGCVKDILKLVDCGFDKFYILQLQTHITHVTLSPGSSNQNLKDTVPFFPKYLKYKNIAGINGNILSIINQDRIVELEDYSRQKLDTNLICGNLPQTIHYPIADIDITIHYLISGPFDQASLFDQLTNPENPKNIENHDNFPALNPDIPLEDQVGGPGQIPTWEIDVSIASDPEE